MRVISCLLVLTLSALMMVIAPSLAQAQDFLWAKRWGGDGTGIQALAVDRSHNVYSVGMFSDWGGTVDFDPGPGTFEMTPSGVDNAYVSKLDRDGGFLWAKQLGGWGNTTPYSAALDDDGNIYVVGEFWGTTDFDPGPSTFELTTSSFDAFVCKLDSSGNFVWAIATSGEVNRDSTGLSVTVDGDHVYAVGSFSGTVDFDPGPDTFEMTSNGSDGFISKLDSAGNFVWAGQFWGPDSAVPRGVVVDSNGDIYTAGWFRDTVDFDPGPGTFNLTSAGWLDVFISKLDSACNFVWAGQLGGPDLVEFEGLAVDSDGYAYTVGMFEGTVDFDPGPGTFELTSDEGQGHGFVSKLDSAGSFVWAKQLPVYYWGVALDSSDNVYAVGAFGGTVDFDPGPGTFELTSFGGSDAFVSKLDSADNFVWAKQLGGPLSDDGYELVLDSSDNVYAGGRFSGTADFDPGPGTFFLTATDDTSVFVWKSGYVDIRLENQDPTLIHFSPDSPAVSFDVVTGLLSDLRTDTDFSQATCLDTFSGNPAEDYSTPPAGDGYYYLARGLSCCTTQGYGDSTLIPDPRDDLNTLSPCP